MSEFGFISKDGLGVISDIIKADLRHFMVPCANKVQLGVLHTRHPELTLEIRVQDIDEY